MRLSEAIRLGAMATKQGRGLGSISSHDAPCAIGAALLAIGRQTEMVSGAIELAAGIWPLMEREVPCPACAEPRRGIDAVWHLNDRHRWTREQIADWVETIERAEDEKTGSATQPAMEPALATRRSEAQKG